jgi:hypothetical protein
MANILYANNDAGTLAAGITNVATTLTLNAGQAALFPSPTPPQVFYVTLTDAATQSLIEIVKVTAVSGNVFSIVRAQDGTTALSWNANDIVSQRSIALEMRGWENAAEGLFGAQGVAITPSSTLGIVGTVTNDNANVGAIGEYVSANSSSSPISSAGTTSLVGLVLTAGDWDVSGVGEVLPAGGTTVIVAAFGASTNPAAIGVIGTFGQNSSTTSAGVPQVITVPTVRFSLAVTTTVFIDVNATFSGGTCNALAFIRARRVR